MSLLTAVRSFFTMTKGTVRGLSEAHAGDDPIALFREWFAEARRASILLPEAMTVATSTPDGVPSARMMLLKGVDDDGFVFYTNYESRKANELEANPHVALVFHWSILERQVRVEGAIQRLSSDASAAYFATRSYGSRIGAWASRQSRDLPDRATLERRVREYRDRFREGEVPLPPFWGGYRVVPRQVEFWQGRLDRLHDRVCFARREGVWVKSRLYP